MGGFGSTGEDPALPSVEAGSGSVGGEPSGGSDSFRSAILKCLERK